MEIRKRAFVAAILAFGGLRIFTILWMAVFSLIIPISGVQSLTWDPVPLQFVQGVQPISHVFLLPWYRWDTLRYIQISEFGYSADLLNTVWPPLYPFLIRIVEIILPDPLLAALVVSSCSTLVSFYLLYLLVLQSWNEVVAKKVLFFTATFPTAFFFVAGYSESLFFGLAVASLISSRQHRWLLAGILAGLAALTRVQGLLLIIPLAWETFNWLKTIRSKKYKSLASAFGSLFIIPLSYGIYAFYVHYRLGANWPFNSLEIGWPVHFDWPWTGILASFDSLLNPTLNQGVFRGNIITELMFSLLAIGLLVISSRKMPVSYHLYAWPLLISGLSKVTEQNLLVSMPRYIIPIFPIYISLALIVRKKIPTLAWFALSVAFQMFFLSLFYLRSFVG